jgi:hypothetical protein
LLWHSFRDILPSNDEYCAKSPIYKIVWYVRNEYPMKSTQYFLHMRQRPDRAKIKMEWIEETVKNADHSEIQSDGRIRRWRYIKEENRFLRVILLSDGETVHNAFFDRGYRGEGK